MLPRFLQRNWVVKLICVLIAAVVWLMLKERIAPGTINAIARWFGEWSS